MRELSQAQVARRKCFRCGARPGYAVWGICADGNVPRVVCADCDIALNALVLQWSGVSGGKGMLARYRRKVRRRVRLLERGG